METKVDNYFSPLTEEEQRLRLKKKKWAQIRKNRALYIMVLPGILYFIIFRYIPMGGLVIAFQDYQPFLGILGSPFVGFTHFIRLFTEDTFVMLMRNTLIMFFLNITISFPFPILLALMLNEVNNRRLKKVSRRLFICLILCRG